MKIYVLGLGESVSRFRPQKESISIGVNDIYKYFKTDYVLCADMRRRFSPERINTIINSTPKKFYSNLDEWKIHFPDNFQKIDLAPIRGDLSGLDSPKFCHSICSPYLACILAYKLGASKIIIYGVDLKNHPTFSEGTEKLERIKKDFSALHNKLWTKKIGLYVANPDSVLSEVIPNLGILK